MLRDITIGQHFPGNSVVHNCDPRLKLVATIAYVVVLYCCGTAVGVALSILLLGVLYRIAKVPLRLILKSLKPIVPIILFTGVINIFFYPGETPLVEWGWLTIYPEGITFAILMAVRILALIAGTSLLTYTTSPTVLTDAIESLLRPLSKLRVPVHEFAIIMTIALRFIPTLVDETEKIMNAQKARGAMLDTGKLFISAFRRADELAMAMECRCYRGGAGRTRLKVLKFGRTDVLCAVFCAVTFGIILATRWVFPVIG